jgi:hypothetical protein
MPTPNVSASSGVGTKVAEQQSVRIVHEKTKSGVVVPPINIRKSIDQRERELIERINQ